MFELQHATRKDDTKPTMNPMRTTESLEKDKQIANDSGSQNQFAAAYLKVGVTQGITYQIKVLTWVAWKLLCKKDANVKNWYLGTEVRNALGFHDLVLKYEIDNAVPARRVYRFVQIKHKLSPKGNVRITMDSLKSKQKKNRYSLIYLFKSYLNMLGKFEEITTDQILDMMVFTNVDIGSIKFLVPVKDDPIFSFEGKGKRYCIDLPMIQDTPDIMTQLRLVKPDETLICDFLRKLVFAVDQPSECELEDQIIGEMKKVFSVPQIFYNDLLKNMIKWFLVYNFGKAPYLREQDMLDYLDGARDMLLCAKKLEVYKEDVYKEELAKQLLKQLRI